MIPWPRKRRAARERARAVARRRARQRADLYGARYQIAAAMRIARKPEVVTDLWSALGSVDAALCAVDPDYQPAPLVDQSII